MWLSLLWKEAQRLCKEQNKMKRSSTDEIKEPR